MVSRVESENASERSGMIEEYTVPRGESSTASIEIFDYQDILLVPRECVVTSRSQCDVSQKLGNWRFKLPIVPANMKSVVDAPLAQKLAKEGYFYVMHRFNIDTVGFARDMQERGLCVSISIGVKQADYEIITRLKEEKIKCDFCTIDVAHGHSATVKKMIEHVKKELPAAFVIAGNVGTPKAVLDLEAWGADCTKIGVGPGRVCITKYKTGFGTGGWQLSAVKWCASVATKPVVADGGIVTHGDIAKSIRFGATFVMVGSLLAAHTESPGQERVADDGRIMKDYFGSASQTNKGERKHVEGKSVMEELRGSIFDTLNEIKEDLQSSVSYGGGRELIDIRKCDYISLKGGNMRQHLFPIETIQRIASDIMTASPTSYSVQPALSPDALTHIRETIGTDSRSAKNLGSTSAEGLFMDPADTQTASPNVFE